MKKITLFALPAFLFVILGLTGCLQDQCERQVTYTQITPVYKTIEEIRSGEVVNEAPCELKNPGKIYFYNDLIFINEFKEGVHVVDNSIPESPQNIAFIRIPGNEDIAIRNGILYASSYIDLLTIDISNPLHAVVLSRTPNVFPPQWMDLDRGIVLVGYESEEITEVMDCESLNLLEKRDGRFYRTFGAPWMNVSMIDVAIETVADAGSSSGTGIGGSMARFTIVGEYLYVVDNSTLHVFSLQQPTAPTHANEVNLGWGIETIFPWEDKLFIGSNSGMFIFDNSEPTNPVQLAEFRHARACDPVFVDGHYAYVTLRDGSICQGFTNQLDLIDIQDLHNPRLVKSFPMDNPHGLSIRDKVLYLCEGIYGLKVFDVRQPEELDKHRLDHETGFDAFDVIALPGERGLLLVIGEDGFYQFDASDPADLKLLSTIPIAP